MQNIADGNFGADNKPDSYAQAWFLRSLIPAFCDPSLDAKGFPLSPCDFHSQNIMITLSESHPRIAAVIDWESSATSPTSFFAQYPLFIVDHPAWKADHPLRSRNVRDQSVFNELMREALKRLEGRDEPKYHMTAIYSKFKLSSTPVDSYFNTTYTRRMTRCFALFLPQIRTASYTPSNSK